MPSFVLCTCRSHCRKYDAEKKTYSEGQLVNRATRYQHRQDDNLLDDMDHFTTMVASTIIDEDSRLGLSHGPSDVLANSPLSRESLPQELLTIKAEVHCRTSWAPTNWALVFARNPIPGKEFENPLLLPGYAPNNGPHALGESNQRNLAFIENENRLFEIITHLRTINHYPEQCDTLIELATDGLQTMMRHKKREWDRQRIATTAIKNRFVVVRTGLSYTIFYKTYSF